MTNYVHNFACWVAARAIHNPKLSGTKVKFIVEAIEKADLKKYAENPTLLSEYSKTHEKLVIAVLEALKWNKNHKFGAAAKIIAIYFKVSIILSKKGKASILNQIYPPIDTFNLKQLGIRNLNWTNIDKTDFNFIIEQLEIYCKNNNLTFLDFESKNKLGG
jgi:hypothetical protein